MKLILGSIKSGVIDLISSLLITFENRRLEPFITLCSQIRRRVYFLRRKLYSQALARRNHCEDSSKKQLFHHEYHIHSILLRLVSFLINYTDIAWIKQCFRYLKSLFIKADSLSKRVKMRLVCHYFFSECTYLVL